MRASPLRRFLSGATVVAAISVAVGGAIVGRVLGAQSAVTPPAWAYGVPSASTGPSATPLSTGPSPVQRGGGAPPNDEAAKHLPDTTQAFTLAELRDAFTIADWYPGDHPTPPAIVLTGRRPDARACGLCHYPNGRGRPENAGLDGLPRAYFVQQIDDFRHDLRKTAEPRKTNTATMAAIAKAMTADEVSAAADYFASIPRAPWVRVAESATVPKTRLAGGMFVPLDGSDTEPIDDRLIEVPEHPDRTDLRDPRSGFVAYVPPGTLKRGEALVTTGSGKTIACAVCHGADLGGLGPVPALAGRSPSYQVRQLFDMQAGTRKGVWSDLMKAVVAKLTPDDMLAIAAYTAAQPVRAQ